MIVTGDIKILHEDLEEVRKSIMLVSSLAKKDSDTKLADSESEGSQEDTSGKKRERWEGSGTGSSVGSRRESSMAKKSTVSSSNQMSGVKSSKTERSKADSKTEGNNQLSTYVIHPESTYRMCWDVVTAMFVLVLIWLVPFYLGFETWNPPQGVKNFSTVMDVWFIFDVFLNFATGYVDHGATVMTPKKIAINYLSSWFVIDFFASVPWEYILLNFDDSAYAEADTKAKKAMRKSMKMSKYFKIPKLLRMARLLRAFNKYARFYALTLVILGMLVTLHCGACILGQTLSICDATFVVDVNNDNIYSFESNANEDICNKYVMSLYAEAIYVCFTLMIGMSPTGGTLGGSKKMFDLRAVTVTTALKSFTANEERRWGSQMYFTVLIYMLVGMSELALIMGHIGLLLRDRYLASAAYRAKLDRVKEEMKYYSVPWVLQNRVLAYYDYMWVNQKQYDDKITLLTDKGMSSDLRGKLALHLYKDVVQGVSLFSRVDDTFLSKVCMELQTRVFLPADWIILKGDIGSELYIISRGVCQVFLRDPAEWEGLNEDGEPTDGDDESEPEILLSNGQFFGEISLLMEVRRTTSVQAKTICEVNVLVQEIFEEILRESPDFANEMKSLIVQRKVDNFKQLNQQEASEDDQEMIEAAVMEAIESRQLSIGGQEADYGKAEGGEEDEDRTEEDDKIDELVAAATSGRRSSSNSEPPSMKSDVPDDNKSPVIKPHPVMSPMVSIKLLTDYQRGEKLEDGKLTSVVTTNMRDQLKDRSYSGMALGNMAGTGFLNSAMEKKGVSGREQRVAIPKDVPSLERRASLGLVVDILEKAVDKANGDGVCDKKPDGTTEAAARLSDSDHTLLDLLARGDSVHNVGVVANGVDGDHRIGNIGNLKKHETHCHEHGSGSANNSPSHGTHAKSHGAHGHLPPTLQHPPPARGVQQQTSYRPGAPSRGLVRQGTRADFYASVNATIGNDQSSGEGEVVVQQLGLLQERIDKIYAMLTTKLGRVR